MRNAYMEEAESGPPPFSCRPGCGACCVAISISTPIPPSPGVAGLPDGKPSSAPCPQLLADMRCAIFGKAGRPPVCAGLKPLPEMCGSSREEALAYLYRLEEETRPR
jgi:uncharacterized protein